jgi:hypothetical protein
MLIHWHEEEPWGLYFAFADADTEVITADDFWYGGRALFSLGFIRSVEAGSGDIRIRPNVTDIATELHLLSYEQMTGEHRREVRLEIPTKALLHFLMETYRTVTPSEEQEALARYVDNWVERASK